MGCRSQCMSFYTKLKRVFILLFQVVSFSSSDSSLIDPAI
jgi:hypothetical protein